MCTILIGEMVRTMVAHREGQNSVHCNPCGGRSPKRVFGNLSQHHMSQTSALVWASFERYLEVSLLSTLLVNV